MTLTVRKYTVLDLQEVLSTWENASNLAHPFLSTDFQDQVRDDIPKLYLPNAETWVAEIDSNVVGFIALLGNEVGALFVQPTFHGKGIGKTLMDKAVELYGQLELEVFKANSIGRKFYAKYGFEDVSEEVHAATGNKVLRLKYSTG